MLSFEWKEILVSSMGKSSVAYLFPHITNHLTLYMIRPFSFSLATKNCSYLEIENAIPALNDAIYIPQHPAGRDVELAIVETSPFAAGGLCSVSSTGQGTSDSSCGLYGATFKDFTYYCDTEGGSSGAPVLSATTNKVIGIHHCASTCENFAVPIPYIYGDIIGLVTSDMANAVEPTPTMAPIVSSGANEPVAVGAGSKLSSTQQCWTLGLLLASLIAAI